MPTDSSIGVTDEQKQKVYEIKDQLSRRYPVKVRIRDVVDILIRDHEELERKRQEDGTSGICIGVSDDPAMAGGVIA